MPKKRGKPVTHPKVINITTGETYETFKEAAEAINGCRVGVYRCCNNIQRHHHNYIFKFEEERIVNE